MQATTGKTKGFTLIELMLVVGIIGILAAIAIPNFLRYQAQARQGEVKTNLAAIYTAQTAYFSEHGTYGDSFAAIGWTVNGTLRYAYGLEADAVGNPAYLASVTAVAGCGAGSVSDLGFSACALGNVDNDAPADAWRVDDTKALINVSPDL